MQDQEINALIKAFKYDPNHFNRRQLEILLNHPLSKDQREKILSALDEPAPWVLK